MDGHSAVGEHINEDNHHISTDIMYNELKGYFYYIYDIQRMEGALMVQRR